MTIPKRVVTLSVLAIAAGSACSSTARSASSGPPGSAPQVVQGTPAAIEPCTAAVPRVDVSSWEIIAAKGFTFCMPPGWKGSGGTRRNGPTTLNWGTGTPPSTRVAVKRRVVMRVGERPMPPELPPGTETRQFAETIGFRDANLSRSRFDQTYYIGALWKSPAVWITGESPNSDAADLMLNIARTVRFTAK
jgi:hypothetical protein